MQGPEGLPMVCRDLSDFSKVYKILRVLPKVCKDLRDFPKVCKLLSHKGLPMECKVQKFSLKYSRP